MIEDIKKQIESTIEFPAAIEVEPSEKVEFGHYSTNIAFKLAPSMKKSPMEIASDLVKKLSSPSTGSGSIFAKIEAVAPGFVNFWLKPELLRKELAMILKKKESFGKLRTQRSQRVNVEFVSANPTGPLTMANGRGGFYGDVLANVLEAAGQKVTREYYVNDTGNQIRLLGESILAALKRMPAKEEYYKGEYIKVLAKNKVILRQAQDESSADKLGKKAAAILLKNIRVALKKAGIKHDVWFSEYNNLHKKGELKKVLEFLEKRGLVYEKDGAVWLKQSADSGLFARPDLQSKSGLGLGDGVLIKSDGNPTYFLADIAYHYDKFIKRKFDLAIDIWGADHHGYAARMKKGIEALGIKDERLKILITQLVRLVSKGKELRMSKRKGEFVTMDDLLKEVGADAARFFFLMHSLDTHMDFDLDLAKERSQKNPVYYAQYAYVRALNILNKVKGEGFKVKGNLNLLNSDSEIKLMLELIKLPDVIRQTARDYQVHRLAKYANDIARTFHNFYEKERVIAAPLKRGEPRSKIERGAKELERARLALVLAVKIVLENLFGLIGISKPKKM